MACLAVVLANRHETRTFFLMCGLRFDDMRLTLLQESVEDRQLGRA